MAKFGPDIMSYFSAPISPYRVGDHYVPASLGPSQTVHIENVAEMIRGDGNLRKLTGQVRKAPDVRGAKSRMLPYVTPMGVFSKRNSQSIISSSGLAVIDFDKAEPDFDLCAAKRHIFDAYPQLVRLAFTSPSGKGLKFFVELGGDVTCMEARLWENMFHGINAYLARDFPNQFMLDEAGKDVCRACFLCHDPDVLYRDKCEPYR